MQILLTIDGEKWRMYRRIREFEVLLAQAKLHYCRYCRPTSPQTSMVVETASRVAGCHSNMCVLVSEIYSGGYALAKFP
jgi:capsule polysaccharide export protein KpsC/LpsZ